MGKVEKFVNGNGGKQVVMAAAGALATMININLGGILLVVGAGIVMSRLVNRINKDG